MEPQEASPQVQDGASITTPTIDENNTPREIIVSKSWRRFVSWVLPSAAVDQFTLLSTLKKASRVKFQLITPDTLLEFFKKKTDFYQELKKVNPKEISTDLLLRMTAARLNQPPDWTSHQKLNTYVKETPPAAAGADVKKKRAVEARAKRTTTEDYPEGGPDVYFFLLDVIRSVKDLQALHSLGHAIDAIIPIDAVPGTANNQRSPDNSKAVSFNDEEIQLVLKDELQLAVRSQEIAAFEETVMTEEKVTLDPSLTDVLAMKVYDILRMKKEYDNWMKTITISRLNPPSLRVANDYQVYSAAINSVPNHSLSVPFIVDAMIQEVVERYDSIEPIPEESCAPVASKLMEYLDSALSKLTLSSTMDGDTTYTSTTDNDMTDDIDSNCAEELMIVNENNRVVQFGHGIIDADGRKLMMYQNIEALKNLNFSDLTEEEKEEQEDIHVDRMEFHAYSQKFTPLQINDCMLLFQFEDMINDHIHSVHLPDAEDDDRLDVNLSDFNIYEQLSTESLHQGIMSARVQDDKILTQYDSFSDTFLVAIYHHVPLGRISVDSRWDADIFARSCFGRWTTSYIAQLAARRVEKEQQQKIADQQAAERVEKASSANIKLPESLISLQHIQQQKQIQQREIEAQQKEQKEEEVSPTEKEVRTMYDIESTQVDAAVNMTTLYPVDGSYLRLIKLQYPTKNNTICTASTITMGDNSYHLEEGKLTCYLGMISEVDVLWLTREEESVYMQHTMRSGLIIGHQMGDRTIVQRYLLPTVEEEYFETFDMNGDRPRSRHRQFLPRATLSGTLKRETRRVFAESGTLTQYFEDGSTESITLSEGGSTTVVSSNGERTFISFSGVRKTVNVGGIVINSQPIGVSKVKDIETRQETSTREDMLQITNRTDGTTIVTMPDGTVLTGYPSHKDLIADGNVNQSTQKKPLVSAESPCFAGMIMYSDGSSETSPLGSSNIRIVMKGDHVLAYYSSMDSAQVDLIKLSSEGKVILVPRGVTEGGENKGIYFVSLTDNSIVTHDEEDNFYSIHKEHAEVKLKEKEDGEGTDLEAYTNDETEDDTRTLSHPPALFGLRRDGGGFRLLRQEDLDAYLSYKKKKYQSDDFLLRSSEPDGREFLTVVGRLESPQEDVHPENDIESMETIITSRNLVPTVTTFRKFEKHSSLSRDQQDELMDELEAFETYKDEREDIINRSLKQEEQIVRQRVQQYLQDREKSSVSPVENDVRNQLQTIEAKKNENVGKPSFQEPSERQKHQSNKQKRVRERDAPGPRARGTVETNGLRYFDHEEGRAFLASSEAQKAYSRPERPSSHSSQRPQSSQRLTDSQRKAHINMSDIVTDYESPPQTPKELPPVAPPPGVGHPGKRIESPTDHKRDFRGTRTLLSYNSRSSIDGQNGKPSKTESPGKRKTRTVVLGNTNLPGVPVPLTTHLFDVFPPKIDFGTVALGHTYKTVIQLVNIGIDTGRYKVKQPKSKELKVHYVPGPVAPGITVKMDLEYSPTSLDALEDQVLRIDTENETFNLPIRAVVEAEVPNRLSKGIYLIK
ncbi:sperm-associated antigen 17 [Planoprotostelium fungivorum]|uniref:Sperm-associated antigen 17 n=1 Tax=Planoprotostelium fungivorum TaxID=1890364 RepID=A0A2P6NQ28_9EUKA|nr:sperm-associated antigen 17 [Planoprotostelium fungivorum]